MMAHAAITVADDDGIGAAALAAFEQARQKIGRTPPPVDAPRQRRFLDALVPLSKDVLLALGRFPQVIGYDAKVGHFFPDPFRSEEHTSELQSLMRISYAVFCLKKTKHT